MATKRVRTEGPLRFTDLNVDAQQRAFRACESALRDEAMAKFRRYVERDIPSVLQAFNLVAEGSGPPYFAAPRVVCDEDFRRSRAYSVRGVWMAEGYDLAKAARAIHINSAYQDPESICEMLSVAVRLDDFSRSVALSSKKGGTVPISASTQYALVRVDVGRNGEQRVSGDIFDDAATLVRRLVFTVAESAGNEYHRLTSREALMEALEDSDRMFRENGDEIDGDELDDERSAGVER